MAYAFSPFVASLFLFATYLHGSPLGLFSREDHAFVTQDLGMRNPPPPKTAPLDEVARLWEETKPWPGEDTGPTDIAGFHFVRFFGQDSPSTPHVRRNANLFLKRPLVPTHFPTPHKVPIKRLKQVIPQTYPSKAENTP